MSKVLFFIGLLTFYGLFGFAQQKIEGIVFDAQTKQRVSKVYLYNTSIDTGVYNNLKGEFSISAHPGDVLLVAAQGYFADTVKVTDKPVVALYLERSSIWLKDVYVFGQKSPEEMLEEKKEAFPSIFEERQGLLTAGHTGAGLSIDALYSLISREGRNARNLRRIIERDYKEAIIDYRFSKSMVAAATGLRGNELEEFMFNFRPSYYFILSANDYKLGQYIKRCYEEYKRNPGFRRVEPLLPEDTPK